MATTKLILAYLLVACATCSRPLGWPKRSDVLLTSRAPHYAPAGAPPKGAPASSAIDATAGRLFADIESALADHDRAQAAPSSDRKTDGRSRGVS